MIRFQGKLLDRGRVVMDRVAGVFEDGDRNGLRSGRLEAHEGGKLLLTYHPYRLALEEGPPLDINITHLRLSGMAGIALAEFQETGTMEVQGG